MTQDRKRSRTPPERASEAALVERYSGLVGEAFALVRVLPGGRALEIEDPFGHRYVLKHETDPGSRTRRREATATADRLGAEAAWPVPAFALIEDEQILFVRQSLMRGAEMSHVSQPLADRIVELIDATTGLGDESSADWPFRLVDTLLAEPENPQLYCAHEPLRQHGAAAARLVTRIEAIGAELAGVDLGTVDDLMHWDLHPGNILVEGDEVTAIVDLDHAATGSQAFDLITFALSAQTLSADAGVIGRLLKTARERSTEALWTASIAHLILRFANYGLRTGDPGATEYWIAQGEELLTLD